MHKDATYHEFSGHFAWKIFGRTISDRCSVHLQSWPNTSLTIACLKFRFTLSEYISKYLTVSVILKGYESIILHVRTALWLVERSI